MYERYDLIFTKDGIEIRKSFDDPLLGKDVRSKKIPYEKLEVIREVISKWKPTIEDISVDELKENNILKGIKTLKIEISIKVDKEDSVLTLNQNKITNRVSNEKIEKAIIKVIGDSGGILKRQLVHKRVYQIIDEFKNPYYHETEPNGYKRWVHRVDTVKAKLRKEGYLKGPLEAGRGVWALTEKGWAYYEAIKESAI